jgi:putative heme-binding domain-containing protein
MESLAAKGPEAVSVLQEVLSSKRASSMAQLNAVWTATRIEGPQARKLVQTVLGQAADPIVKLAALHSISLWRDSAAAKDLHLVTLLRLLDEAIREKPTPGGPSAPGGLEFHYLRVAIEALGRIGAKQAIPCLLKCLERPRDRTLEHAIVYALIEIGDREPTAEGLKSVHPGVRRAALIALDQMDGGGLDSAAVTRELNSNDRQLSQTAWWIAGRHQEWGSAVAEFLRERLKDDKLSSAQETELIHHLAQFASSKVIQDLLSEKIRLGGGLQNMQIRRAVRAMGQTNLKEAPDAWGYGLAHIVSHGDPEALAALRTLRFSKRVAPQLAERMLAYAKNESSEDGRLTMLAAVPGGLPTVDPALLDELFSALKIEQPVARRSTATEILAHAKLSTPQLIELIQVVRAAGPMEIDRLLEPFTQTNDARAIQDLLVALKSAASRSSLRVDALKARFKKFEPAINKQAEELYQVLNADTAKQTVRLEQLLSSMKGGDVRRGQRIFHGTKVACASCHAIGYLGGTVGPDLTHIGQIRSERDLLESIAFPSASFVRSYEPVSVATKNGKAYNGLIRQDTAEEMVLVLNATEQVHIPKEEIEDIQPSKVSIMPAGLDQQLSVQELADLVAFLKACR